MEASISCVGFHPRQQCCFYIVFSFLELEKTTIAPVLFVWLLSLVFMSFPFFRLLRLGPRQDCLSLSSLAQGHLVPANPRPLFSCQSFLLPATLSLSLAFLDVGFLSTGAAQKWFLLDCRGFLSSPNPWRRHPSKHQATGKIFFPLVIVSIPPPGLSPLSFQSGVWLGDENKALCPCKLQCEACG